MQEARANGGHATRGSPSKQKARAPRAGGASQLTNYMARVAKLENTASRARAKKARKDELQFPEGFGATKRAAVMSRFEDLWAIRDVFDEAHDALVDVESGAAADAAMASDTLTKMRDAIAKGLCTCDPAICVW